MSSRVEQIREALRGVLAPLVAAEGGLVYLTVIHEREVVLHFGGRLAGSPGASLIHNELALPLIDAAAPGTIVHFSSGRLVPRDAESLTPPTTECDGEAAATPSSIPVTTATTLGPVHEGGTD
ncbi:MAG: hypothetical protein QM784_15350 [Polyangiaceae bacterium]